MTDTTETLKTMYLIVLEKFPSAHYMCGLPTNFVESIKNGSKKHTIRLNYEFWAKRIAEIEAGRAYLSIRVWVGRPYGVDSKQEEIQRLTAADGVGVQKIELQTDGSFLVDGQTTIDRQTVAKNDGLGIEAFDYWFKKVSVMDPLGVLHFSPFRY